MYTGYYLQTLSKSKIFVDTMSGFIDLCNVMPLSVVLISPDGYNVGGKQRNFRSIFSHTSQVITIKRNVALNQVKVNILPDTIEDREWS